MNQSDLQQNSSQLPEELSELGIVIDVIKNVLCVTAICANVVLVIIQTKNPALRSMHGMVIAQAICDGSVGFVGMYQSILQYGFPTVLQRWYWIPVELVIRIYSLGSPYFSLSMSTFRWTLYRYPGTYKARSKTAANVVYGLFISSITINTIYGIAFHNNFETMTYQEFLNGLIKHKYYIVMTLIQTLIGAAIFVFNILLLKEIKKKMASATLEESKIRDLKISQSLVIICTTYLCTWTGMTILQWLSQSGLLSLGASVRVLRLSTFFMYANAASNLLIYSARSKDYQSAIREVFCGRQQKTTVKSINVTSEAGKKTSRTTVVSQKM